MKRQNFLLGAVSGLTVVANPEHVFARALAQTPRSGLPGGDNRCLVLINLAGGNDGLNTLVPFGDQRYYQMRQSLAIAQSDVLSINNRIGFNSVMKSLKGLYDKGTVAVVQSVGYPDANHSHFRSTEIWQTAAPDRYEHSGWVGRYFDQANLPASNLFNGIALAPVLPEALLSNSTDVLTLSDIATYKLAIDRSSGGRQAFSRVVGDGHVPFASPYLSHVMEIEDHAQRGSEDLPSLIAGYKTSASYPATPLGRSLALAAQIIGSKLGTRVLYVQQDGFDTHVSQKPAQNRNLREFSDAVAAFYSDLESHGNDKRVLTLTFSEFGRRIEENASHGTDHGEASPLFLIGGGVKGGLYGQAPDLGGGDAGNIKFSTDFRSVYATVLERWLGRPSAGILNGSFPKLTALG